MGKGERNGDLLDDGEFEKTTKRADKVLGEWARVTKGLGDETLKGGLEERVGDGVRKELQFGTVFVPRLDLLAPELGRLEDAPPAAQIDLVSARLDELRGARRSRAVWDAAGKHRQSKGLFWRGRQQRDDEGKEGGRARTWLMSVKEVLKFFLEMLATMERTWELMT